MTPPVLVLLGRRGCHLCEAMRTALDARLAGCGVQVREVDITADPELESRYGWDIPVLLHGEREICRHALDPAALAAWLSAQGIFL